MAEKPKTIGVTPDPELMEWLRQRMGPSLRWSGPTHFFNWAIAQAKAEEEKVEAVVREGRLDALMDMVVRPEPKKGRR